MKRIVLILSVLGLGLMCLNIKASDVVVLINEPTDITDFSNMVIEDNLMRFVNPVAAEIETNYTFVVDKDFIGQTNYLIVEPKYQVCSGFNLYCQTAKVMKDQAKELWYATFEASDDMIFMMSIPVSGDKGSNFVLYHGEYVEFLGFEAYKNKQEQEGYFLVDVDNLVDVDLIKNQLTASDDMDGNLTSSIDIISDSYTTKDAVLGEFLVRFGVKDKRLNAGFFNMYVKVVDVTPPVIIGLSTIELELGVDDFSLNQIKSQFNISDNVDVITHEQIVIKTDEFSLNKNVIGTYPMSLEVVDLSKNKTSKSINIRVKDTIAPHITGPTVLFSYVSDASKTVSAIKNLYQSNDLNDGNISKDIQVDLKNYNHLSVGDHHVLITSTDSGLNTSSLSVVIKVIDDVSPTFDTSSLVLKRTTIESMTEADIIAFIKAQFEALKINVTNVEILLNEVKYASNDVDSYVYFSYDYSGKTYQSRVFVQAEKTDYTLYIYVGLTVGLIGVSGIFIKRRYF